MAGFRDSTLAEKIGERISNLGTFGMRVDDMLIRNSHTVGTINQRTKSRYGSQGFGGSSYNNDWDLFNFASNAKSSKSEPHDHRGYKSLRSRMRNFARQDLIEEIVETLADECIVYDEKNFFAYPSDLSLDLKDDIKELYRSNFNKIYLMYGFNDGQKAWQYFKKWLIDGYLSFEIIFNDAETEIIGFKEIDPVQLEFGGYDKDKGIYNWIYTDPETGKRRTLPDAKVVYISYSGMDANDRASYVQRLVKPFNILDIMEQTRVIYAVTQSVFNKLFTIPVGGKSKSQAKQSLASLIGSYKEQVQWNSNDGELRINGSRDLPFYKEYWFPEKNGQRPQVESVQANGPDLSNMEPLDYFANKLYRASKIPSNRFDEPGGGRFNLGSPDDIEREEIRFSNFVKRLRSSFKELLVKPLWVQTVLDRPSLEKDAKFESEIGVKFVKNNLFEMLKKQRVLEKQAGLVDTLKRIEGDSGDRESYFTTEFLVREYMDIPEDKLEENTDIKERIAEEMPEDDDGGGRRF